MDRKQLNVGFDIKQVSETGDFAGYGSVFDVVDLGYDRVKKGAFMDSIREHGKKGTWPAMFYSHDHVKEIGEWKNIREDDRGLFVEGKLWIDGSHPDPDAMKAYRGMKKEKGKMGLSIGYSIPDNGSDIDDETGIRDLEKINLWEVSPTVFPMNEAARVDTVKSTLESGGMPTEREIEQLLRDVGFAQSQAKEIISNGYKSIHSQRDVGLIDSIDNLIKTINK